MISSYRRAASQTSSYTNMIPTHHHLNAEHLLITPTHFHMIRHSKSSWLEFNFKLGNRASATPLDLRKVFYKIFWKANRQTLCSSITIVLCGKFSGNYKKQLQHLNKWHRHLCTIWELCPALPTEMVAICRSRGQHGTHQPLYEVMAVVHWIYTHCSLRIHTFFKGYPSVSTLMVSYSAVFNQLAQQRLCHHIKDILLH